MNVPAAPRYYITALVGWLLLLASPTAGWCQAGENGGKPIITYNTTGAIAIKTQSPPAFPGGDDRLDRFIVEQVDKGQSDVQLPRKLWLTASIDPTGKVIRLVPTHDSDPTLKREMDRIGRAMPRWTSGKINEQGVNATYQFLVRR